MIEGGGDFPDEAEAEPNFNREGATRSTGQRGDRPHGDRPPGGDRGGRGGRPGAAAVIADAAVVVDVPAAAAVIVADAAGPAAEGTRPFATDCTDLRG